MAFPKRYSLLDRIAGEMRCLYVSDLRYLTVEQRRNLISILHDIIPTDVSLYDWNDALKYLVDAKPEETEAAAKEQLIELLTEKTVSKLR